MTGLASHLTDTCLESQKAFIRVQQLEPGYSASVECFTSRAASR